MSHPHSYSGPAFLSYGFRPFFMAACLFAVVIIPLWMLIWHCKVSWCPSIGTAMR